MPFPQAENPAAHSEKLQKTLAQLSVAESTSPPTGLAETELEWHGLLARILSQVEDAVNVVDTQHRIIYWNNAAARLYGIAAEDALGHRLQDIYDFEYLTEARPQVLESLARDGWWAGDCLHRLHLDGREILADVSLSVLRDTDGSQAGFLAVIRDTTQRSRAEAAQRFLSEASAAINNSLDCQATVETIARQCVPELADLCVIDLVQASDGSEWPLPPQTQVSRVAVCHASSEQDELASRLSSYPPDLRPGSVATQVLAAGHPKVIHHVTPALLRGVAQNADHLGILESLSMHSCVVSPLVARGKIIGLLSLASTAARRSFGEDDLHTINEITRRAALAIDHAQLFEQAQKLRREAEAANKAKDEFLAIVSHELRTPLTPILGWASMLLDAEIAATLDEATRKNALNVIQQSANTQAGIIDDLLDVSRIISGNLQLNLQPVRLRAIAEAALDVVRGTANEKNLQLWTAFDRSLNFVNGDARRLQQVVANLLTNAIKFTPDGGRIEVRVAERDGNLELEVSDSGMGIPPEFMPRLFDRFAQSDSSASRSFGGLGLGLAITKDIVTMHGGTVSAHSDGPGHGSTFRVSLPLVPARSLPEFVGASDDRPNVTMNFERTGILNRESLRGARVLLIDDEQSTREMLAEVLLQSGALAECADSAVQARQIMARWRPQVIVCDIGMPDENGYDFIAYLRALHEEDGGHLPAIALTAYAREDDRQKALRAGFSRHVAKPVRPVDLVEILAELLAN